LISSLVTKERAKGAIRSEDGMLRISDEEFAVDSIACQAVVLSKVPSV
jgi:hypothetical protein